MLEELKVLGKDILKCTKYSCILSVILMMISGLIALITSKANWMSVLESMKATLFIVGSIGLLIGAVSILLKHRNKNGELEEMEEWKTKFNCISFKVAVITMSFVVIICGCMIDQILFYMYY